MIEVINPATGELIQRHREHQWEEVEELLYRAQEAFVRWRDASSRHRAELLRALAGVLRQRLGDLAVLMAREMGKPVSQGRGEVEKCATVCEHYADHAARYLATEPVKTEARVSRVSFQPLGLVLGIMPWNFPFWQVLRFAAPAVAAGNVALLKHAPGVAGCALALVECFARAGFPDGVFSSVVVEPPRTERLIARPEVDAVTFTGSVAAGRAVGRAAGQQLKKCVLELGGSDPYLILQDADLETAARICAASRLINSGQSCVAAKRFVVLRPVHERFLALLADQMRAAVVGDPLDPQTGVGPLARADLRDALHHQVTESVQAGARLICGGEVPPGPGAWYPPTVLSEVQPGMPAYHEELFGPVAAVMEARDEAEVVRLANDSRFGLGAAVFTADLERGERMAEQLLEAGCCFVNSEVRSDPRLPFGGIRDSGFGRELGSFGIREFVNVKTIYVA